MVLSAEDQDSKTEAPSAKRLSEAHSKGQFARAPELTVVFTLAAALFTFGLAAREASDKMMRLAVVIFGRLGELRVTLQVCQAVVGCHGYVQPLAGREPVGRRPQSHSARELCIQCIDVASASCNTLKTLIF